MAISLRTATSGGYSPSPPNPKRLSPPERSVPSLPVLSAIADSAVEAPRARGAPSGARSGALLAVATLTATALNYVFLLATGRLLGSDDYGALAALLGLLTLVVLPTGAVQLAVSREVSRRVALGDDQGAAAFGRALLW